MLVDTQKLVTPEELVSYLFLELIFCPERDLNRSFSLCLLEFERRLSPLSHHGWLFYIK